MSAYGEPQIAGVTQCDRKKNGKACGCNNPNPALPTVKSVEQAKSGRQNDGSGPEADSFCQRVQQVSSQRVFLAQSHQCKEDEPNTGPGKNLAVVQRQLSK